MKKIFSLVVLFACAMIANAQSSMLATLNHEGTISTFYGATALREAHAAAAHGDVITLSSGSFTSVDITKAITLRGAGMEIDTVAKIDPTVISGDFSIQIADSVSQRLTIEGVYNNHAIKYKGTLKNVMFLKSRFKDFVGDNNASMKNASLIHCKIANCIDLNANSSASCINCAIEDPLSKDGTTANFEFQNCVIKFENAWVGTVYSSTLKNCIIYNAYGDYSHGNFDTSCMVFNSLGFSKGYGSSMFANMPNSTNTYIDDIKTVFKTYTGQSFQKLDSENFELTDEAKSKYLGTDGTQVGIYGGSLPFTSTPSNPQITKCNVAAKSTADGKLSVDIEVKAAE